MRRNGLCKKVPAVFLALALALGTPSAQAEEKLAGYNAAIGESSISGVSAGAFMAVQFATAWSSVIMGVGVVAGGPYWCAKADSFFGFWSSLSNALGRCMKGPLPNLEALFVKAEANSASGAIDPLQLVSRQKIYIFHGYNDSIVARGSTDAAAAFYRRYLRDADRGNLYYQTAVGAGHSLVVGQDAPGPGLNKCNESTAPFIDTCGYDQAGIILQHIYGPLKQPGPGPLSGTMKPFDQSIYTRPNGPTWLSLARTGYVFVPRACENGEACRVHIALHGCEQDIGNVDRAFVDRAGYNAWADANRLIVLYPQIVASWYPYNPHACWDWWGYISFDDNYVTKAGLQIKALKAMLDALTSRAMAAAAATPPSAPIALTIVDTSDNSADLVWTPQAGATGYRVWRAVADGQFAAIAEVPRPGFADSGLTPRSAYRWRIAALTNGVEGPPSNEANALTRAAPACANPGSCPWGN
ncbi:extracellular catalytic domain type 2 short-chain-length polyhydroxyalkanoate depolymerase [Bradyrhizobium sp.]|uniref:extracellular catalytic domain type 2 short-chain-length polyhydroxyalkanoate depolymerase n=1 Tax=Bradyrhizobium sp. TaxID=376 RepID=UPI0040378F1E